MRKVILTSLAAILFAANANAGLYVGGYGAYNTDDKTISIPVVAGYAFDNGFRAEVDFFAVKGIESDADVLTAGIAVDQVKVLYDFNLNKQVKGLKVYAGLGLSTVGVNTTNPLADPVSGTGYFSTPGADGFAAGGSFIAGVSYALNSNMALDLQYNRGFQTYFWMNADDSEFEFDSEGNTVKLGLVYNF